MKRVLFVALNAPCNPAKVFTKCLFKEMCQKDLRYLTGVSIGSKNKATLPIISLYGRAKTMRVKKARRRSSLRAVLQGQECEKRLCWSTFFNF